MLLEVRLMQSRRGEREFATPKFCICVGGVGDCGLVAVCFFPQIRNYAPNMIQKRKESASLVKGGAPLLKIFLQKERYSQILLLPLLCLSGLIHILICNTKIGEKSDMAKSRATFCCSGT